MVRRSSENDYIHTYQIEMLKILKKIWSDNLGLYLFICSQKGQVRDVYIRGHSE